jgi:hypothetical protein
MSVIDLTSVKQMYEVVGQLHLWPVLHIFTGGDMRKLLAKSVAVGCAFIALQACNRNANPNAPTRIATIPATNPSTIQSIQIARGGSDSNVTVGQSVQLRAVARLIDGSDQDITSLATWDSDNPSVATVSSGLVTALRTGAARIRASYLSATGEEAFSIADAAAGPAPKDAPTNEGSGSASDDGAGTTGGGTNSGGTDSGGTGSGGSNIPPTVQKIVITGDHDIPVGKSGQLHAIAYMSDGSQKDVTASSDWRNDNSLIGAISQSGVFTGLTPGSNVVTANYDGTSASQPVQVTPF